VTARAGLVRKVLGIALFRMLVILAGSVLVGLPFESARSGGIAGALWGLSIGLFWLWWDGRRRRLRETRT
jgi:membrane associated rhomboid family serine protease